MAFVFQSQRWQSKKQKALLGPGSYNINGDQKAKLGVISPQDKKKYLIKNPNNNKPTNQQIQKQIQQQLFQQQLISMKRQTTKKLIKRVKSGKLHSYNSYRKQNVQTIKKQTKRPNQKQQEQICLQVYNNVDQDKQKQFQNKLIRDSIKHSNNNQLQSKKTIFNDKSLRLFKPLQNQSNQNNKLNQQQNVKILQQFLNRSKPPPTKNLKKFVKYSEEDRNCFIAKSLNQNFFQQTQNFIIASDNCKLQKFQQKKNDNFFSGNDRKSLQFQSCGDVHTTGIEQDSSQSQFQYIKDDTPGPGYYQIRKDSFAKKTQIQKFGITQKRFKQKINNDKILDLNIELIKNKIISRASQYKVAFGKSRPLTAKMETKQNLRFFQDTQAIQKKYSINSKRKISSAIFSSKSGRFKQVKTPFYNGPDFFDKDAQASITIPNSIFMSKVQRNVRPHSPTAKVDFQGQNMHTIQKKIEKVMQNFDYLQQQYPGFSTRAPRFNYKQEQIDDNNRFMVHRIQKIDQKTKGFTFSKDQKNFYSSSKYFKSPPPGNYETQMKWIKHSHHIRFKI